MMKLIKYMGIALAMTAIASCSNEDELNFSSWENDPSAVHFQATVGKGLLARTNPDATVEADQTKFNNGDKISVAAESQNPVIYTLTVGGTWTPAEGSYLKWEKGESMNFKAYYPATEGTSMTEFTIPTDQTSDTKIAKADYMTFNGPIAKANKVNLTFERKTARIMVKLNFNSEFARTKPFVSELKIKGYSQITNDNSSNLTYFNACKFDRTGAPTYAALVAPNPTKEDKIFFISLNVNEKQYSIQGLPAVEAGYSYTYNLKVGRNRVEVESVSVANWQNGAVIEGGTLSTKNVSVNKETHTITTKVAGKITQAQIEEAAGTSSTLVVAGPINGADMKLIREATGCTLYRTGDGPVIVTDLNLKDAQILASDDVYVFDNDYPLKISADNSIGGVMFYESKLKKLVLPSTVTIIEYCAFYDTGSLSSVTLPEMLREIGVYAFTGSVIQSINLPSTLTTLGENTFSYAANLTSVTFNEGIKLTTIPNLCFSGTSSLTNINIPSSVTTIGNQAFSGSVLQELTIPETVTTIGTEILGTNNAITSITILGEKGNRDVTFAENMFANISSPNCTLMLDQSWMEGNSTKIFKGHEFQNIITDDITVDPSTNTIITQKPGSITPDLITQARNNTAKLVVKGPINGTDIKAIREAAGCTYNCDDTGIATVTDLDLSGALIKASSDDYCTDQNINADNHLGTKIFMHSKLIRIVVPSTVTSFDRMAFFSSYSLESCNIPEGVKYLGEFLFDSCTKLNNITVPASINHWNEGCFYNCTSLSNFIMEEGIQITTIPTSCFGSNPFKNFTIPESVTTIKYHAFRQLELDTFTIPANVTFIDNAIFDKSSIQTLTIEGPKGDRQFAIDSFESLNGTNKLVLDISWKADTIKDETGNGGTFMRGHFNEIVFTDNGNPVLDSTITQP